MAINSTINTLYSSTKTITYKPTVLPPTEDEELVGLTEPVVNDGANTPISSSLLSAINSSITCTYVNPPPDQEGTYVRPPIDDGSTVVTLPFDKGGTIVAPPPTDGGGTIVTPPLPDITLNITRNVYGAATDISNAERNFGYRGYNYIRTDKPGFVLPTSFTSNDIILGGTGTIGGIGNVPLNGATRLGGVDRNETIKLIKQFAGTKNVYGVGIDLQNAKNILGTAGYNYISTDATGFVMPTSFSSKDIILGGAETPCGIGYVELNGAIRLAGTNTNLTAQAINNYNSPKYVYGNSIDLENGKKLLGFSGYNYIQTDEPGFVMPASFSSNDIILGGTGAAGGIGDIYLNGATRLAGQTATETSLAIMNFAESKNVYGSTIDISNAKRILGTIGYNYIQTNKPGFVMPTSFTSNDIILGGTVSVGGIGNVNLNGAIRLEGTSRDETIKAIINLAGKKNVYGAGIDLENAKNILGTADYNYIATDGLDFVMPTSFSSMDMVLGGIGTQGGIGDINLNGATRLAGANRELTAQAINNYNSPKYVYGNNVDLENAKKVLGYSGYNYIQSDEPGFVMPASFNSNDIIIGGTGAAGGIGDVNINGATRLAGVDREDTARLIRNYSVSKNVYGTSVDLENAKNILGTIGYNYIDSGVPGFIKPPVFTSNDIILGGTGTPGGIGETNLNGAVRLAGANRDLTAQAMNNYLLPKNVYGAKTDLDNARTILGTVGYNYIQTDLPSFNKPSAFTTNDIILGYTGTIGGISDVNLNGATRLAGTNREETLNKIRNYAASKNVYGTGIDLQNAKNILGTDRYNYIDTGSSGFIKHISFTSNDIVLGGAETTGGIGYVKLNGAVRLAGADRDLTAQAINNYAFPKNVFGAKVDLDNAKNIFGSVGYNYIQTDLPGFIRPSTFTTNDIILGGTGTIGGIGDVNLNGAKRIAGINRDETAMLMRNYVISKKVYGASVDIQNAKNLLGTSGYNYIQTDQPGFRMPVSFTSNDIILGGTGTLGGIGNVNLNGAVRLAGASRELTIQAIMDYAGIKIPEPISTSSSTPVGNGSYTFLQRGSKGELVRQLQTNLTYLGYNTHGIDGDFGTNTYDAVVAFQTDYKLLRDGIVGPSTQSAIDIALNNTASSSGSSIYLSAGCKGEAVIRLQTNLKNLEFYKGDIDGDFGIATQRAVLDLQSSFGIYESGVVDTKTSYIIRIALKEMDITDAGTTGAGTTQTGGTSGFLKRGDSGTAVVRLQTNLRDLEFFKYTIDGEFGLLTEDALKTLQRAFEIDDSGQADPVTLTTIRVALSEMIITGQAAPSGSIRIGDSGAAVEQLQRDLQNLGYDVGGVDGDFGPNTYKAVVAFQRDRGLTQDGEGVVGSQTKNAIKVALSAKNTSVSSSPFLSKGSKGEAVIRLQTNLRDLGFFKYEIDGDFGTHTQDAVKLLQRSFGFTESGVVDPKTLTAIRTALAEFKRINEPGNPDLKMGDSGPAVRQLQSDLTFLKYDLGTIDGEFGSKTYNAVVAFQRDHGLEQNGIVDIKTRDAINSEVYKISQGSSNPDYEKDKLKDRLISITNRYNGYHLNKSMSFDAVKDIFFKWYQENHSGQYLEATYLALPEDYRIKALNHWADMINQGYDQGMIADYILPEDYFKNIPDRPDTDSNLGSITKENKYDSKAAFEYYKKYYYPVDALTEMNYKEKDQNELARSRFGFWARLVYGSSEAEKGQEFRIGIIYGFGMTGIKMASDCIEGLQELTIGGGYKKLPGMASFLAKATVNKEYREALYSMVNQSVEQWKAEYNNADPFDKGRIIGDMIGQTFLSVSGAIETAEGIKNFIKSGGFKTAFKGAVQVLNKLKNSLKNNVERVFESIKSVFRNGDELKIVAAETGQELTLCRSQLKSELLEQGMTEIEAENALKYLETGCFSGDTLVHTNNGLRRIDEIQEGDYILAKDVNTGITTYKEVKQIYIKSTSTFVHLNIEGEEIKTTASHLFFTNSGWWKAAENIKKGDKILNALGALKEVSSCKVENLLEPDRIYNLNVEEFHTYYVGNQGLLVHNACFRIDYTNSSGRKLWWVDQDIKNVNIAIDSALKSTNVGKAIEGKVASFVREQKEVTGFGQKVERLIEKNLAGDLDVVTKNELIEVKKSIGAVDLSQLDKYSNPMDIDFLNKDGKDVILYIDEAIDMTNKNNINILEAIKAKRIKVVNSLNELKGVLK